MRFRNWYWALVAGTGKKILEEMITEKWSLKITVTWKNPRIKSSRENGPKIKGPRKKWSLENFRLIRLKN